MLASMGLKVSREFWEDVRWEEEHYAELERKHRGNWVAIADKKVVAYGKDLGKVEEEARRITGRKEVYTTYVEAGAAIYKS